MLGGPIAGSLSHPSSDSLLPELGPAFLQYPPDELVMGAPKSVVLWGGLGLVPVLRTVSSCPLGLVQRQRMDLAGLLRTSCWSQTGGLFWIW